MEKKKKIVGGWGSEGRGVRVGQGVRIVGVRVDVFEELKLL